jgi:hypothetical protein
MTTATACPPADLMLVARARKARLKEAPAGRRAMLAHIPSSGVFELLDAAPWTRALGYTHEELGGKWLCDLMEVDGPAAREVIAALLDGDDRSLEVTLRCKDGGRKSFTFYRRFDAYAAAIFVLADDRALATEQSASAPSPTMADGYRDKRSARPDAGRAQAPLGQL